MVPNLRDNRVILEPRRNDEYSALGHGLNAIDHDIQNGLLHQINVNLDRQPLLRQMALDGHAVLLGVGSSQLRHIFHQSAQVDFFEVKIARPGEIHQRLHDAIQAADFGVDDVHVAARIGLLVRQFVLQKLQVQHDGVDRILHLVRHAASETSAGRKTA